MSIEEFRDGCCDGHLGHGNATILAILNLHVAPMFPTEHQLNLTYSSGGDVEKVKLMTDGRRTDDGRMDMDDGNRPQHKLTGS